MNIYPLGAFSFFFARASKDKVPANFSSASESTCSVGSPALFATCWYSRALAGSKVMRYVTKVKPPL